MQENRSFDHYFGTLRGVRGFGDKQALTATTAVVLPAVQQQQQPQRRDQPARGRGAVTPGRPTRGRRAEQDPRRVRALLVHQGSQQQRTPPGVVDRRPRRVLRASVLHPRLRRPLRQHRAPDAVLKPELWRNTALFITYDEHDGFFDHQLPPFPEPSVTDEHIAGLPIGPGTRVPMLICSPWTRGGYVDSNVYDHTSMLRFLAAWTGVQPVNVTPWRASVTGDLTAAFDFQHPDFSVPRNIPTLDQTWALTQLTGGSTTPPAEGRPEDAGPGAGNPAPPPNRPPALRRCESGP